MTKTSGQDKQCVEAKKVADNVTKVEINNRHIVRNQYNEIEIPIWNNKRDQKIIRKQAQNIENNKMTKVPTLNLLNAANRVTDAPNMNEIKQIVAAPLAPLNNKPSAEE